MKKKITATVLSQKEIAPRIFDMWIATELAACAKAGQFIGVYPKDRSTLLPRPISICQVNDKKDALRIVYRIAGQGTAAIRLVARIDRLFEQHDAFELLRRTFQLAENQRIQRFRGEIEGEGERIETKHGELPSLMRN